VEARETVDCCPEMVRKRAGEVETLERDARWKMRDWDWVDEMAEPLLVLWLWDDEVDERGTEGAEDGVCRRTFRCKRLKIPLRRRVFGSTGALALLDCVSALESTAA
jgi:hypothetical protein